MPIWLRKFYIRLIQKAVDEENKQAKGKSNSPKSRVQRPGIRPK